MRKEELAALEDFHSLSENDKKRCLQCVLCREFEGCARDETDEDENGMCKYGPTIRRLLT